MLETTDKPTMDAEVNKTPSEPDIMDQIKALFHDQARRMDEFEQRMTKQLGEVSEMIRQGQEKKNEPLKRGCHLVPSRTMRG